MPDNKLNRPPTRTRAPLRREVIRPTYFFTPDLEREISRLEGITAARVLSSDSDIDEIHVIAPPQRPPKKIVRDIESLLLVRFGIRIDHRRISVVQSEDVQVTYARSARPLIRRVEQQADAICVDVQAGDQVISGTYPIRENDSPIECTSRALINAIEQMLNTPGLLALAGAQVTTLRKQTIVLILLHWTFSGQQEVLVGGALSRDDELDAAARATLDAINRKLVRLQSAEAAAPE